MSRGWRRSCKVGTARSYQKRKVNPELHIPQQVEKVNAKRLLQLFVPRLCVIAIVAGGRVVRRPGQLIQPVLGNCRLVLGNLVRRDREKQRRRVDPPDKVANHNHKRNDREEDGRLDVLKCLTGFLRDLDGQSGQINLKKIKIKR